MALSIFLGFRNNAAYGRFWEGRKLWGALVNTSRSLARQAYTLLHSDGEDAAPESFRQQFVKRIIALVHALRHYLRDTDPIADLERLLHANDFATVHAAAHRPLAILQFLRRDVSEARDRGWLHELNVPCIDEQLVELSNILGACERIKNTPIPFNYTVLIHRIVAIYCFSLPLGLIDTTGELTPVVVFLIAQAFFGLDAIGDEIEDPFGTLPNHLPLATISRNIEINLLDMIDQPHELKPLAADGEILD